MRVYILILLVTFFGLCDSAFAISEIQGVVNEHKSIMACSNFQDQFVLEGLKVAQSLPICLSGQMQEARSGCCSYHGGVCGCTGTGSTLCCDGQPSPSCGC